MENTSKTLHRTYRMLNSTFHKFDVKRARAHLHEDQKLIRSKESNFLVSSRILSAQPKPAVQMDSVVSCNLVWVLMLFPVEDDSLRLGGSLSGLAAAAQPNGLINARCIYTFSVR